MAPVLLLMPMEMSQAAPGFLSLKPPEKSQVPSGLTTMLTLPSSFLRVQLTTMGLEGATVCCVAGVASAGAGVPAVGVCAGEKPAARAQKERSVKLQIVLMEMGKFI